MTKRVMSDFAEETKTTQNRQLVVQSPKVVEALDDWDRLSEKTIQNGLDEIEKYVERFDMDQRGKASKK